jgi:hypothetical protein
MIRALQLHPTSHCGAEIAVSVDARRPGPGRLSLAYRVTGELGRLYVPPPSEPLRTDDLWKRTCFEAFVLPGPGEAYVELNLAPSGRWATYHFDRYREGMRDALDVVPSPLEVTTDASGFRLSVTVALTDLAAAPVWRLGLTAVIEEEGGRVSHWAIAHPRPQPDFHDAGGFVLELAA